MKCVIEKGLNPLAAEIRKRVFIEEQGFCNEFDDIDQNAFHALIYYNGCAAATGRLFFGENGNMKIGRVAVLKEYRGKSLGKAIITALEEKAESLGCDKVELSAQVRVKGFYESLGYKSEGGEYPDEGCPHVKMVKKI